MVRPVKSEQYERQWHEIAEAFEEGVSDWPSPPFPTESAARDFRLKFYSFRSALRAEAGPQESIYRQLDKIVATLTQDDCSGEWIVRFQHRDTTPTATMLDAMIANKPGALKR